MLSWRGGLVLVDTEVIMNLNTSTDVGGQDAVTIPQPTEKCQLRRRINYSTEFLRLAYYGHRPRVIRHEGPVRGGFAMYSPTE